MNAEQLCRILSYTEEPEPEPLDVITILEMIRQSDDYLRMAQEAERLMQLTQLGIPAHYFGEAPAGVPFPVGSPWQTSVTTTTVMNAQHNITAYQVPAHVRDMPMDVEWRIRM